MTPSSHSSQKSVRYAIVVGTVYYAVSAAANILTRFDGGTAFLWVATALLIAVLAVRPRQEWGKILFACGIGSIVQTMQFGLGLKAAFPFALINLADAVLTVLLLKRCNLQGGYFETQRGIMCFTLIAGGAVPLALALPAASLVTMLTGMDLTSNAVHWFLAHALGTITFTPFLLLIIRGEFLAKFKEIDWHRKAEAVLTAAIFAAVCTMTFWQTGAALLFLPFLPMVYATLRLGRFGAAGAIAILALIGGVLTLLGQGPMPLIHTSAGVRFQFFQFYLACAALLLLPVAALLKQRKLITAALVQSEARFRLLAERNSDAILNIAVDGTILYASPAVARLAGFDPQQMIGHQALDFVMADYRDMVKETHLQALANPDKTFCIDYQVKTEKEDAPWCETNTQAVVDDRGIVLGVVSAIRDVSARKATELRLMEEATTDPLTGLLNRRAFLAELEQRMQQVSRAEGSCAFLLLDLDHFKSVNDRHGHPMGDTALKLVSETAKRSLRADDHIGRLGGEEFGIILWNESTETAYTIADRLRAAIGRVPLPLASGHNLHVTCSAGLTIIQPGMNLQEIMASADAALYLAKESGRNCLRIAA